MQLLVDDDAVIVIESFQPVDDGMIIHELLHHYLEGLTVDSSLNHHQLIIPYTIHMEWLFLADYSDQL
jgi:hypothetical protein